MSDPNPAGAGGSAPPAPGAPKDAAKTPPAPPAPPAPPPKRVYKVSTKNDWMTCVAANEGEAQQKFQQFFGVRGTDHEYEIKGVTDAPGKHSGQKNADTTLLTEKAA